MRRLPGTMPRSARKSAMSACPQKSAAASGVPPSPCASRSGARPCPAAGGQARCRCRSPPDAAGVQPRSLAPFGSAPRASSSRTIDWSRRPQTALAASPSRSLPFVPRALTEARVAIEQLAECLAVARLDRAERAPEGLAALGQVVHVATECRPAREAVLPREHEPRCARAERADLGIARVRERGVVGAHDRDPARQAALHDAAQAFGAVLVVADVIDERVRQGRAVRRDAVDVGLELRPAGKPVLARERELRIAQAQRLAAGSALAHELLGLFAQLLQARGCGQWRCHAASSPARPSSACPGGKEGSSTVVHGRARVGSALPADGAPPAVCTRAAASSCSRNSASDQVRHARGLLLFVMGMSID